MMPQRLKWVFFTFVILIVGFYAARSGEGYTGPHDETAVRDAQKALQILNPDKGSIRLIGGTVKLQDANVERELSVKTWFISKEALRDIEFKVKGHVEFKLIAPEHKTRWQRPSGRKSSQSQSRNRH